jgi:type IV pilus assembly protein PilV
LVEVMVALIVCSIGLLGLAKMESLALASSDVAGTRAIAALEASSLAAMMHADRGYWSSTSATPLATVTWVNGTGANITDSNLQPVQACTVAGANSCNAMQMAAYDVQNWAAALQPLLPGYTAAIQCTPTVTTGPVTCTITITWVENAVAANSAQAQTSMTSLAAPRYTLNVEP